MISWMEENVFLSEEQPDNREIEDDANLFLEEDDCTVRACKLICNQLINMIQESHASNPLHFGPVRYVTNYGEGIKKCEVFLEVDNRQVASSILSIILPARSASLGIRNQFAAPHENLFTFTITNQEQDIELCLRVVSGEPTFYSPCL